MESYLINKELFPNYEAHEMDSMLSSNITYEALYQNIPERVANIAIFNKTGSGKVININSANLHASSFVSTSGLTGGDPYSLHITNSLNGGIEVPYIKMDSASANLTGITATIKGTTNKIKVIRNTKLGKIKNLASSTILFGNFTLCKNSIELLGSNNNTAIQKIILREGEGLAIGATVNNLQYYVTNIVIEITILVQGGGVYMYSVKTAAFNIYDMFSLFNESGSGNVLEIISINIIDEKIFNVRTGVAVSQSSLYYLTPITNINELTGNNITPIKYDSQNSAISSDIIIKENCVVYDLHGWTSLHKRMIRWFISGWHAAFGTPFLVGTNTISKLNNKDIFDSIELNEGEGIALMAFAPNGMGTNEINIDFTITDAPAPPTSSGETGFAYA